LLPRLRSLNPSRSSRHPLNNPSRLSPTCLHRHLHLRPHLPNLRVTRRAADSFQADAPRQPHRGLRRHRRRPRRVPQRRRRLPHDL
jgi:hypothetical protein